MEQIDWNAALNWELVPTPEELEQTFRPECADWEGLVERGRTTQAFVLAQWLYEALFSLLILSQSGLDRLDRKLARRGWHPPEAADQKRLRRYSPLPLRFFFLAVPAHIERLEAEQMEVLLDACADRNEGSMQAAAQLVRDSWKTIMAVRPDQPEMRVELFPSLRGEGMVRGAAVALVLSSAPSYDERGMLTDIQMDDRRIRAMYLVADQAEAILSEVMGGEIRVLVEV